MQAPAYTLESNMPTEPRTDGSTDAAMGVSAVRKIIHVDMDAFYASVEQRDQPELKGKPVAVGWGGARGVVASASYEARAHGVRSAMPSVSAMRRCPDLVFLRPRFDVYREVSRQIRAIFAEHTDLIEPLALDEAYLDVTRNKQGLPTATEVATVIRARIEAVTGVTASAGISYNKFLAKMASGLNKPNGQAVITPARGEAFVAALSVKRFHGVGPATAAKMEKLGILTGADLKAASLEFLTEHFGKFGRWYHDIARGIDERPVEPNRPRKSVGAEDTFAEDIRELEPARREVAALVEKVWRYAEPRGVRGRTVTLKVKYSDFSVITRRKTEAQAFASPAELLATAFALLDAVFPSEKEVRLLGVTLSSLSDPNDGGEEPSVPVQPGLWGCSAG